MNGCERLDQVFSYYNNLDHKTVKWWKRIFTWIIEVVRAYSASHRKKKQFYERLIEGLYEKSYTIDVNVIKSDLAHLKTKKNVNIKTLFVQGGNLNHIYTQKIVLRHTNLEDEIYHDFILPSLLVFIM